MSWKEIVELCVIAALILGLSSYYLIKAIKNNWLGQLTETINDAIAEAEKQYPEGNGDKKKEIVLNAVKSKCKELGIPYDLLYKLISKFIDKVIQDYNVVKGE